VQPNLRCNLTEAQAALSKLLDEFAERGFIGVTPECLHMSGDGDLEPSLLTRKRNDAPSRPCLDVLDENLHQVLVFDSDQSATVTKLSRAEGEANPIRAQHYCALMEYVLKGSLSPIILSKVNLATSSVLFKDQRYPSCTDLNAIGDFVSYHIRSTPQ
jgi:hypothetical protein